MGSIIIFCFVLRGVDTSDRCSTSEPWLQPGVAFLNLFFKVTDKSHLKKYKMLPDSTAVPWREGLPPYMAASGDIAGGSN